MLEARPEEEKPAGAVQESTVLLVDDDRLVARATARLLKANGLTVSVAGGGREAIEMVEKNGDDFDVVLIDLRMPDMDGRTVFRALREIRRDLPVVFYSGDAGAEHDPLIMESPNTAFLQKPFSPESLMARLREAGL